MSDEYPEVVIKKKDILRYDDKGIEIEYKGDKWIIEYGKFVNKDDIDKLSDDDEVIIRKFKGDFGWRVSNIHKKSKNNKEEKERTDVEDRGIEIQNEDRIQNIIDELFSYIDKNISNEGYKEIAKREVLIHFLKKIIDKVVV